MYNPHILLARWEAETESTKDHIHSATSRNTERPCPKTRQKERLKPEKLFSAPSLYPPYPHTSTQDLKKNQNILIIFAFDVAEERIYC